MAHLARRVHFCCAHRYHNESWTEEKNRKVYGELYSPHGLGHNFILEVHIQGPIHPETGLVIPVQQLDQWIKEVTSLLDHKHLNFEVKHFQSHVPSTENIAKFCYQEIKKRIAPLHISLRKVRLQEGDDLWVDVGAWEE